MGGGSSDAAFTLKLLNDLFSAGLSQDELRTMAAQLGADCAFFIDAQPAYAEGIGERLEPLELDLSCYHLMMVKPPVAVSTKEAFSSIHSQRPKKNCRQIVAQPIESWREELVNDFEQSIFRLHPELTDIKAKLYQAGAVYAAMSGSGSSLFGIFEQKPLVEFPGCWTAVLPPEELFPIVDELGNILGCITRKRAHDGTKVLHPVVHLHVFNSQGQLYLQKRPEWKDIQPGKWDTSVGGHVDFGEDVRTALRREVSEELGINDFTPEELGSYMFEGLRERELVYVHKTVYDGKVNPSKEELDDGRFWSPEEITENMGKGIFTPNFEDEYRRFFLKE
jgi:isopentenyldiphosphate isomerase